MTEAARIRSIVEGGIEAFAMDRCVIADAHAFAVEEATDPISAMVIKADIAHIIWLRFPRLRHLTGAKNTP